MTLRQPVGAGNAASTGFVRELAGTPWAMTATSLGARLLIAQLRLTGAKRTYDDLDALRRSIRRRTNANDVEPPARVRRRLVVDHATAGGGPCYTLSPVAPRSAKHVLYFHGGAAIHQIQKDHWAFLERLVDRVGCTVTVPIYPLAPEHHATETVALIKDVYDRFLADRDPGEQVIMGDSVGGALALVLSEALEDARRPQPKELVLISPWLDLTMSDPAQPQLDRRDPYLAVAGLDEAGRMYAGALDRADPLVSPLFGPLSNLGRVSVFVGTRDILLPDARRLRDRARADGVELEYYEYPGMFHAWCLTDIPEGRQAAHSLATIVRRPRHVGTLPGAAAGRPSSLTRDPEGSSSSS